MKKFLALLLAVVMVLSLAACGSQPATPSATEAPTADATEAPAAENTTSVTRSTDTYSMIEGFDITSLFSVDTDALQSAFQFDSSKLQFDLSGAFTLNGSSVDLSSLLDPADFSLDGITGSCRAAGIMVHWCTS